MRSAIFSATAGIFASGQSAKEKFQDFQVRTLGGRLPRLPVQSGVFGSIFQTAYYFMDLTLGHPDPQTLSMIIDTGSSTQGLPCDDCQTCGQSHWDDYYNKSKSEFNEKYPCGQCSSCRFSIPSEKLKEFMPQLLQFVTSPRQFQRETTKLLTSDTSLMQCLYNVYYAEGSSLSGLFYKDVVWMNKNSSATRDLDAASRELSCASFDYTSIPIRIPVGCHTAETHLFYEQKASGILGMEYWGSKGVPTFPTAILAELEDLYHHGSFERGTCSERHEFRHLFALCLSDEGGIIGFGHPNSQYHKSGARERKIPLLTAPGKSQSYTIGLRQLSISRNDTDHAERWQKIELRPSAIIYKHPPRQSNYAAIPTLVDSGTTLSYFPSRIFNTLLHNIEERVAKNHERRMLKERIHQAVPRSLMPAAKDNFEFIPVKEPITDGPKKLVRISDLASSSSARKLFDDWSREPFSGRQLRSKSPAWYAVYEPSEQPEDEELLGFLDMPEVMLGARPRSMVQKVAGYGGGDCWWLPRKEQDLSLFPKMNFFFGSDNTVVTWQPENYLYTGANPHFYCLAFMTDSTSSGIAAEDEVVFGSNSFVNHDVIFEINQESPNFTPPQVSSPEYANKKVFHEHPGAYLTFVPARCPSIPLSNRKNHDI